MRYLFQLFLALAISSCKTAVPSDYIRSAVAPTFGEVVSDQQINNFLDSAEVSASFRFYPVKDSIPNRKIVTPLALLFSGKEGFVNKRFCNAHYKDIKSTISFYAKPKRMTSQYLLQDELLAIKGVQIEQLPSSDFYLIFYYSLYYDNLMLKHIKDLQKSLQEEDLSLTILYVNVDNRKEYNLTAEAYKEFLKNGRTKTVDLDDPRWFQYRNE
jgi:hypothetical protein